MMKKTHIAIVPIVSLFLATAGGCRASSDRVEIIPKNGDPSLIEYHFDDPQSGTTKAAALVRCKGSKPVYIFYQDHAKGTQYHAFDIPRMKQSSAGPLNAEGTGHETLIKDDPQEALSLDLCDSSGQPTRDERIIKRIPGTIPAMK